jgi:hypothetical protein
VDVEGGGVLEWVHVVWRREGRSVFIKKSYLFQYYVRYIGCALLSLFNCQ